MKKIKIFLSAVIMVAVASMTMNAQVTDPMILKQMIESKNFVFTARTVNPQRGSSQVLTSEYDIRLTGDKLVSFLPYFGRAYAGVPYSGDGGIKFTSTDFEYKAVKSKKGWGITIVPKDASEVQQMYLDVSSGGYATLQVTSTNRSMISYYGVLEKVK